MGRLISAASLARRVGSTRPGRALVGWIFSHMSFVLPVQRLYETEAVVAFWHPNPSYPFHVLIVPKSARSSLAELEDGDGPLLAEIFKAERELARRFKLEQGGYRFIANGGTFQDFPQLHFHLIADTQPEGDHD